MEQKALKESPAGQIVQRPEAEDEIDLVELFYLLWGHAWQIALCLRPLPVRGRGHRLRRDKISHYAKV